MAPVSRYSGIVDGGDEYWAFDRGVVDDPHDAPARGVGRAGEQGEMIGFCKRGVRAPQRQKQ